MTDDGLDLETSTNAVFSWHVDPHSPMAVHSHGTGAIYTLWMGKGDGIGYLRGRLAIMKLGICGTFRIVRFGIGYRLPDVAHNSFVLAVARYVRQIFCTAILFQF